MSYLCIALDVDRLSQSLVVFVHIVEVISLLTNATNGLSKLVALSAYSLVSHHLIVL